MLTYLNLLKGVLTLGIVVFGVVWGIYFIYQSKKTHAKLLFYMGLMMVSAGLIFSALAYDFLYVLITDKNMVYPDELISILTWMWVPPTVLIAIKVSSELLIPEKKKIKTSLVSAILIIGILFELTIFLDPKGSLNSVEPVPPGTDFYDADLAYGSLASLLGTILIFSILIFGGFGYLHKSIKSEGIIRRKYFYLAMVVFLYAVCGTFDGLTSPGIVLVFIRFGLLASLIFWYLCLKEEHVRPSKKIKHEEDIILEESLFRLAKRPDHITEEEITFHKERKICLVCKGKVAGVSYICPECDTLYCIKCSDVLSNAENACWVCNHPFDKSKPVIPFDDSKTIISSKKGSSIFDDKGKAKKK
jgi:hypothetical protein